MYEPHEIIGDLIETDDQRDGRVYGAIEGKVTDISDSDIGTRVKARLAGMDANLQTDWLDAGMPGSIEATPSVGDAVIVMFVEGDPHRGFYFCHPISTSKGRPTQAAVLGTQFVGLYNDLITKFNTLQANYQALYGFVQGHVHVSFGTVSASLIEAVIGALAHNNGTNCGRGQDKDGAAVSPSSSDAIVLSGKVFFK